MRVLIELYTEEIPAGYLPEVVKFAKKFFRSNLKCRVQVFATNRRVVIDAERQVSFSSEELKSVLFGFIKDVPFPKRMKWDESGLFFARPIRSILCVDERGKVISFEMFGLKTSNITYVMDENLKQIEIVVDDCDDYYSKIYDKGIILSQHRRTEYIKDELLKKAQELGCVANIEDKLLSEVSYLVEKPTVEVGRFNEKFLALPNEVLITSMAKNQKLFTFSDKEGKLTNIFAVVLDGKKQDTSSIIDTVCWVLSARLSDALFFWEEDLKINLKDRVKSLSRVVLHNKIGSYYDKILVMLGLADVLIERLGFDEEKAAILKDATYLSKADLETAMVYEFPELEGIMGYYYALKQGFDERIALAIRGHIKPQTFEDDIPDDIFSQLVGVLDRTSDIVAYFGVGLKPTGTQDPYGVRRMVLTLIKLVCLMDLEVNLDTLIREGIKLWKYNENLYNEIADYFSERVISFYENYGIQRDIATAVWRRWQMDIRRGLKIGKGLSAIKRKDKKRFGDALKVVERAYRIIRKEKDIPDRVDPSLFEYEEEKVLWDKFSQIFSQVLNADEGERIEQAINSYANFSPVLHNFFSVVMVNVEDKEIKGNRLAMMKKIRDLFSRQVAEFF